MMIRPFTQTDIPALARIHRASWMRAYKSVIPPEVLGDLSESHFERIWEKKAADVNNDHWVAESGNRPTGFISFRRSASIDETDEISALYIAPDMTGRGFGKTLLNHALYELKASGFKIARLWVVRENHNARGFYEAAAFKPTNAERIVLRYGVRLVQLQYGRSLIEDEKKNALTGKV